MTSDYRPQEIEERWQRRWLEERTFQAKDDDRPHRYILEMLPYPSGRLHMGHVRTYTMGDVVARFQSMRGRTVVHPIGWDSLGLPAENAAMEHGVAAKAWTLENIANMRAQFQRLGLAYDWSSEIASHEPEYYRWNQWMFLRFLEKDLAYRKLRAVHWCSKCRTVLANEQVEDGRCYRCDTPVVARELEQWFFRTTRFQAELLDGLEDLPGWPESLRKRQRDWIGRSEGARVRFRVAGSDASLEVFTTRLDTIHGCTFVVIAPDHPVLERLGLPPAARGRIEAFAQEVARIQVSDRGDVEKKGLPTGALATNPYTGEDVPIWVANFVVKDYGTGAVMSVPAHDERDLELARREGLPIRAVIRRDEDGAEAEVGLTEDGVLAAGTRHDGMTSKEARAALLEEGRAAGFAEPSVVYRLRDWGVSRQRYWGTPIPIIHCATCGIVPVPDEDLPVILPDDVELTGESSALARHPAFAHVECPRCHGPARRESDTMDTFVDSAWYFVRYLDPRCTTAPFRPEVARPWLPVDLYIGGPEHAVGHLIYSRWWMRALREIGLDVPAEPFTRLIHHGMVTLGTLHCPTHGWRYPEEVRDGLCIECGSVIERGDSTKMSKSKRNIISPTGYVDRFGADALRVFSMFTAPAGQDLEWSDAAVEGMFRFIRRVWRMATRDGLAQADAAAPARTPEGDRLDTLLHRTIHRVTTDLEDRLQFNTPLAALMELLNALQAAAPVEAALPEDSGPVRRAVEGLLTMLCPFAPHACEEAWEKLGHATPLSSTPWPSHDPARLLDETVTLAVQISGKLRGQVLLARGASQEQALEAARGEPAVARHLEGMTIVKVIHVENRLLNLVIRPN